MTLTGHELTIVQLKFSYNGKYLLSVSRDRSWKLYAARDSTINELNNNEAASKATPPRFELVKSIGSKNPYHTRIIWSCDWSHDDKYFVTTSRDKRACVWLGSEASDCGDKLELNAKPVVAQNNAGEFLELSDSITTCAFAPEFASDNKR
jgi:elongator complex protein 2